MEKKNNEITYRGVYLQPDSSSAIDGSLDGICEVLEQVFTEKYDELIFMGCGTSLYLAQVVAHAFSTYNAVPVKTMCCSEFYYLSKDYMEDRKVLVLPITRESYTVGVRMAINKVGGSLGVRTLAITCDRDSALYNDYVALPPDTAESSVTMTHSPISMVYLVAVIAVYADGRKDEIETMTGYTANAQDALKKIDDMTKKVVMEHEHLRLYITLGQSVFYDVTNECMNKMKEMGPTNSEVYYTLEYRHGPMSPVGEDTLVLSLGSEYAVDGDSKLLTEMKNYGAVTAAISNYASTDFVDVDYTLDLPYGHNDVQNVALVGFTGQFMGYYTVEKKGLDADTPRHLS